MCLNCRRKIWRYWKSLVISAKELREVAGEIQVIRRFLRPPPGGQCESAFVEFNLPGKEPWKSSSLPKSKKSLSSVFTP